MVLQHWFDCHDTQGWQSARLQHEVDATMALPRLPAACQSGHPRPWRRGFWGAALVLALVSSLAQPGAAQPSSRRPPRISLSGAAALAEEMAGGMGEAAGRPWLRERLGVPRATELLVAPSLEDRARGIERLGADGSEEALEALVEAMAPGSAVRANPKTLLLAVRAAAPHAAEDEVRSVLVSVLSSVRAGSPETALDALVRMTAALALAKAGTKETLTPLVTAVISGGRMGDMARQALLAYPPASLETLIHGFKKGLSPNVVELLGDLGDPRAIGVLRYQLKHKSFDLRAAAAVALAKLGDETAAIKARKWLEGNKGLSMRQAAVEALMVLDAQDAPAAIAKLLGDAKTRAHGLGLAERALSPALVPTLVAVVEAPVTQAEKARAASIIGQIGGARSVAALKQLLAAPELATTAAFGLAVASGGEARALLERALVSSKPGPARRLVLRAGLVRFVRLGERLAGLGDALAAALAAKDPADRAVGSFGLALLGERTVASLMASQHPEIRHAAARAALVLGPSAMAALDDALAAGAATADAAPLSGGTGDEPTDEAVVASLALLVGAPRVSTTRLARWAELGGPLAPMAAYRLAVRDSKLARSRLRRLLAGTDPVVRLHALLGLAASPEKDAVSLLTGAYRFEADPQVRRAILRALSVRSEKHREATLALARDLDPDGTARALGRAALAGRQFRLELPPNGRQVAWVALRANSEQQKNRVVSRLAQIQRADGLTLPLAAAPDGVLIVPGLSDLGSLSVRLAPASEPGQP